VFWRQERGERERKGTYDEVETKLDSIQCSTLFSQEKLLSRCEGVRSSVVGAVCGVAHKTVEDSPCRAEDPRRGTKGRLFEGQVGFLGFLCWYGINKVLGIRKEEVLDIRRTVNPTAVPNAIGSKMDAAGLAKTAAGSVRDGMKLVIVAIL
jgi:hypothetical protein